FSATLAPLAEPLSVSTWAVLAFLRHLTRSWVFFGIRVPAVVWFSVAPIGQPVPSAMAAFAATAPRARQANSARAIFLNRMVLPLDGLCIRDSRADLRSGRATVVHTYTKGNKPEYLFPNLGIPSKCASQR